MLGVIWTLISVLGLLVALAVLADTMRHYARFKRERPYLVRAYRIEVVQDLAISLVQAAFATLGAAYLLRADPSLAALLTWLLFAAPVLLTVASLNHYWSRRRL